MADGLVDEYLAAIRKNEAGTQTRAATAAVAIELFLTIKAGLDHKVAVINQDMIAATLAAGVLAGEKA